MVTVLVPHFGAHEHSLFLWNTKNLNTPVHTFVGHRYAASKLGHFYWGSTASSSANPFPLPPLSPTPLHPPARTLLLVVVQHGAHSAEEPRSQPFSLGAPLEELVVEVVVPVQQLQVLGQRGRAVKLVNVEEGVRRGYRCILLHTCPHHNWNDPVVQGVGEELLGDIVLAVGVLEGKVELVVLLQHLHAVAIPSGAFQAAAAAVDIHLGVGVLKGTNI